MTVLARYGDVSAVGVSLLGSKSANNFGECDLLSTVEWNVLIAYWVEGVSAFHALLRSVHRVGAYALA